MSTKPITFGSDVPTVFPPSPLSAESSLDASLARLAASVKTNCATIDRLILQRAELRGALQGLLDQVDSLHDHQLTRDLRAYKAEANWDNALDRARTVLRLTR